MIVWLGYQLSRTIWRRKRWLARPYIKRSRELVFELTAESLRTWVRKDEAEAGRREAGGREAEEPTRLRVENARLLRAEKEWHLEREVLRRAAACFVREVK